MTQEGWELPPQQSRGSFGAIIANWPIVTALALALWSVATAGAGAAWAYYQFKINQEDKIQARVDAAVEREEARLQAERNAALTRRIEAQKPFLQKKLDLFFETIQVAQRLTEWEIDPKSPKWQEATKRFWELRWGELEMVGDPGIRQAARRLAQQIVEVEYDPGRDRHDLRWMVECLADELRLALEHAWGIDAEATRIAASGSGVRVSKLPSGCTQGPRAPGLLNGMKPLHAPGNLRD